MVWGVWGGVPGQPGKVECVVRVAGNTPFLGSQLFPRGNLQGWSYKKPLRLLSVSMAGQGGGHRRVRGEGLPWANRGGYPGFGVRGPAGPLCGRERRRSRAAVAGPKCSGDGGGGAGPLRVGQCGMGDNVPAHPWLAARRLWGRIAEWCSGELWALPYQSVAPSVLLAEAPGAVLSLHSFPGRGVRATLPGRGGEGGVQPAAARGSSAAAPGPTRGSGRPSAPRTAPARRGSAPWGGQRRRPLSGLAAQAAPSRRARPMVVVSCSSGAWRGRRGEESRPPAPCPTPHLGASSLRGTSDASGDE